MSDNNTNVSTTKDNEHTHEQGLKVVELSPGKSFKAGNRTYRVAESFSIGRLSMISMIEEELTLFGDMADAHSIMKEAMRLFNVGLSGDAYALLKNKVETDYKNAEIMHYALRACTVFINYDGEDLRTLTNDQIKEKISDWSEAGLDALPFMSFAVSVYRDRLGPYKKDILSILEEKRAIDQILKVTTDITNQETGE